MSAETRPEVQPNSQRELAPIVPIAEEGVRTLINEYTWYLGRSILFNQAATDYKRNSAERQSYREVAIDERARANVLEEMLKLLGQEAVTEEISQKVRTKITENISGRDSEGEWRFRIVRRPNWNPFSKQYPEWRFVFKEPLKAEGGHIIYNFPKPPGQS